jgi:hypothetical protein
MKLKLFPSSVFENASESAAGRSFSVPFLPHRCVSRPTAWWAITIGVWPVLIAKIFSAGARERRQAKQANQTRSH